MRMRRIDVKRCDSEDRPRRQREVFALKICQWPRVIWPGQSRYIPTPPLHTSFSKDEKGKDEFFGKLKTCTRDKDNRGRSRWTGVCQGWRVWSICHIYQLDGHFPPPPFTKAWRRNNNNRFIINRGRRTDNKGSSFAKLLANQSAVIKEVGPSTTTTNKKKTKILKRVVRMNVFGKGDSCTVTYCPVHRAGHDDTIVVLNQEEPKFPVL